MKTLPSFQERSIQYQSVNRFPAISSIQGEVVLAPGKHLTSLCSQAAPPGLVACELPLIPWGEGQRKLAARAESWQAFRRATWVAEDAGRRRLQSRSRAGEGEGAQPVCLCRRLPQDAFLAGTAHSQLGADGQVCQQTVSSGECSALTGRTDLLAVSQTGCCPT